MELKSKMSYEDIARTQGRPLPGMARAQGSSSRPVESMLLKLANHVSALKKLVDALGSPKDTVDHRHKISNANNAIQELAKSTKDALSQAQEVSSSAGGASPDQQYKQKKLLQDFAAILQDYKATQRTAQEREAASLPRPSPTQRAAAYGSALPGEAIPLMDSATANDKSQQVEALKQQQAQLVAQRDRELAAMEAGLAHNAALIEERDQGIREISHQIGEVNEMFQDLAVLINDQGVQITTIDDHITSTAERSKEGTQQLVKASRSQRAHRNKCLWLWLVAALVVSLIIILAFA
mmetsp:Transcript_6840/g.18352  ORF Transcript_6840/g.18352 Transcript_6840/m.18352 type:complete len:295 (-) Transcript_6840:410-1294(-)